MGAAGGSTLSVTLCVTGCVGVLCECVCPHECVSMCLWDMYSALLLVEPAKGKASAMSLSLDRDPGSPGLGSSGRAGGIPRPGAAGAGEHL